MRLKEIEATGRVGFKAWYNAETQKHVILSARTTHMDALMKRPTLYNHSETWDIVAAIDAARAAGWVRLAVEVSGNDVVAMAQSDNPKQALSALRWLRNQDSNEWDILRVHTFLPKSYHEIVDGEAIDRYLKTGRSPNQV